MATRWHQKKKAQEEAAFERELQSRKDEADRLKDQTGAAAMGIGDEELFEKKMTKEEKKAAKKAAREAKRKTKGKKGSGGSDDDDDDDDDSDNKEKINVKGVQIPILPAVYEPILKELEKHGIKFKEKTEKI